jgi:hypothetical protein
MPNGLSMMCDVALRASCAALESSCMRLCDGGCGKPMWLEESRHGILAYRCYVTAGGCGHLTLVAGIASNLPVGALASRNELAEFSTENRDCQVPEVVAQ